MASKIILKKSSVVGKAPAAGDLDYGELALNYADGLLYYKRPDNTISGIGGAGAETDPVYTASSWYTTTNNSTNWDAAYNWGNHASAGYLTSGAVGVTVQGYSSNLTSWASLATSAKQDALVSGTNIKTINGSSLLGSGDLAVSGGSSTLTIQNKTAAYTVVAGDLGTIINCTSSTFTVSLTAAATLGAGFNCWVWNTSNTATDAVTIDPNASETIDGVATLVLRRGEGLQIVCDGTNWQTGEKKTMRGYAENFASGSTRATASGSSAMAIGSGANAAAAGAVALGNNTNATGAASVAIGLGTASATNSTVMGNNSSGSGSQAVTGAGAMALGGSYASGTDSFAAAVANNTSSYGATGANSVAIGYQAKATNAASVVIGYQCIANGGVDGVAIGKGAQISNNGIAIGQTGWASGGAISSAQAAIAIGQNVAASAVASVAIGVGARADIIGKYVYSNKNFSAQGDAQTGSLVLMRSTTDAAATTLTSNNSAAAATNQVILPNNSAYAFTGIVVARQQAAGGTASAAWKVEGLIRREGTAASTVLVNSALTVIDNQPGWTLALSADTTNGGLAITATGAAATNTRWVATIQTSEVTYA